MSKRFGLMGLATVENEYLGGGARLTCSDRTASDVDTEIMETLKQCYEQAKELLSGNRDLMDKLAAHLIEKETISGKEFMKIYRREKGIPEPEDNGDDSPKNRVDKNPDSSPKESGDGDKSPAMTQEMQQAAEETKTGNVQSENAAVTKEPEGLESVDSPEGTVAPEDTDSLKDGQNQTKGLFSNASSDIFK